MSNRVYVSSYQAGHIEGLSSALSLMTEVFLGRPSGVEALFYASLFQAGVSKLVVSQQLFEKIPASDFVRERTQIIDQRPNDQDYKLIRNAFSHFLPKDYFRDEKFSDVWTLEFLLSGICAGLRYNLGVLFPGPIPQPESLRGVLPPELLLPAANLIHAIRQAASSGPLPRYEIQKTDVNSYQEILRSDLFGEFSVAHNDLALQDKKLEDTLPKIHKLSAKLQKKYLNHLKLSQISLALLPIVPKIMDKVLGAFPGKLADYFTALAKPVLEDRTRLVIYDTSRLSAELLRSTLFYVVRNRDDESVARQRLEEYKRQNRKLFPS